MKVYLIKIDNIEVFIHATDDFEMNQIVKKLFPNPIFTILNIEDEKN